MVQEEREAVVVFPLAYHQGFNHGFNMAEAVNFGSKRWVEYGKRARGCLCLDSRTAVKIEMTPFVQIYQPELLESWKQGDDFKLHPEDPDFLHLFFKDVRERFKEGTVTEGEWEEVRVTVRDMGSIPDWYKIRFGVQFGALKDIVPMKTSHHENDMKLTERPVAVREVEDGQIEEDLVELKRKSAVLRVQRWWREKKREQVVRREQAANREKAAVVLQAMWRGFQARQHFTAKMGLVLKLQALTRGFLLRQRLIKMRKAARLLQGWWKNCIKMRQVRSDFVMKKGAAGAVHNAHIVK